MIKKCIFYITYSISIIVFPVIAQEIFSENFNVYYYHGGDSVVLDIRADTTYLNDFGTGDIDSLHNDWSGTVGDGDIVRNGWVSYASMEDSSRSGSPLYEGGSVLSIDGVDDYWSITDALSPEFDFTDDGWSLYAVFRLDGPLTMSGDEYGLFTNRRNFNNASIGGNQIGLRGSSTYKGFLWRYADNNAVFGEARGSSPDLQSVLTDGNYHSICISMGFGGKLQIAVDGVIGSLNITESGIDSTVDNLPTKIFALSEAGSDNPTKYFNGRFSQMVIKKDSALTSDLRNAFFLPPNWSLVDKSKNGGITRKNFAFHQIIENDTIFYDSLLVAKAQRVNISISDSAGSAVDYKLITSVDKSTWTTINSSTTSTSWQQKKLSGILTGYFGIAVPISSAGFDNIVITIESLDKSRNRSFSRYLSY